MITTRALVVAGLAYCLAFSAGMSGAVAEIPAPLTAQQRERLAEVQRVIEAAARVYPVVGDVELRAASWVAATLPGAGAVLSGSRMYLAPEVLEASYRDALVAAALAHRIVHRGSRATSLAEYERELRRRAIEADALAVEILVRINGQPENAAVQAVARWLLAQHGGAPDRHPLDALCEELRDLAARFPQHHAAIPRGGCDGSGPGATPAPRSAPALLVLLPQVPALPPSTAPLAGPEPVASSPTSVPPAYCTPGHRLRNVYQCP